MIGEINMNNKISWITKTAAGIALLVLAQYIGKVTGAQQLVTGSLVNLVLILSAGVLGITSAVTIGLLSPLFAQLIGVGVGPTFFMLVPNIMIGNILFVITLLFTKLSFTAITLSDIFDPPIFGTDL